MKAAFAHDFPFIVDDSGNYYSRGGFPYTVWKRYLNVFDTLTVLGRLSKESYTKKINTDSLTLSSGPNVKFVSIPNLSDPITRIKKYKIAKKIITKELNDVDVLIARLPSEIGLLSIKVAKEMNKPYLIEVVGCAFDALWNHGSFIGKLFAPISYKRVKKAVREGSNVIYVTQKYLQDKYPTKGNWIGISNVEIPSVDPAILQKRLIKIDNLNRDSIIRIGLIASLESKYKGIDIAIRSMKYLKSENIKFEFHILGKGDSEVFTSLISKLKLNKNIYFDGVLKSGSEVHRWLDNIDIYIQPSLTEGLPRALVEAMSRGCPAIATNVGGIPELLGIEFLVAKKNEKQLAEKIIEFIQDKDKMKRAASENFFNASNYYKSNLDQQRTLFLSDWINSITFGESGNNS